MNASLRPSSSGLQCGRAPIPPPWRLPSALSDGRGPSANRSRRCAAMGLTGWRRSRLDDGERHASYRFRVVTTSPTARTSCSARPARFNNARRTVTRFRPSRQRSLISRKPWIGSRRAWSRRRKRSRSGQADAEAELDSRRALARMPVRCAGTSSTSRPDYGAPRTRVPRRGGGLANCCSSSPARNSRPARSRCSPCARRMQRRAHG